MKPCVVWMLGLACLGMGGCAQLGERTEPASRRVTLGGESYMVRQMTESTWTVSATGNRKILAETPAATATLRQAVEMASDCRVTDSDYSRQGTQFDAQVSCESGLDHSTHDLTKKPVTATPAAAFGLPH